MNLGDVTNTLPQGCILPRQILSESFCIQKPISLFLVLTLSLRAEISMQKEVEDLFPVAGD